METKKIGVIGAGKLGTALAMTLSGKGHAVTLWVFAQTGNRSQTCERHIRICTICRMSHCRRRYEFTDDLQDAVQGKDLLHR